jgi:hypothetical protein
MGDTANWEFAAVVAAVVMGLGGLLIFTLAGVIGGWRAFRLAGDAARAATAASVAVQDLARQLAAKQAALPNEQVAAAASALSHLRADAASLLEQQQRLQEATRKLVEARVLGGEDASRQLQDLESAIGRLEEHLRRVAEVVDNLGHRAT